MMTKHDNLRMFQEAYLDYLEGDRDAPPALEKLGVEDRKAASAFINTFKATRGINPYASRPSIEQLLESHSEKIGTYSDLMGGLQDHLRKSVDSEALVTVDVASDATGLDSSLVVQARGICMRVVEEESGDLGGALAKRANDIATVFSTFADCQAVLYTTCGKDPHGVVLVRGDVFRAIETPSGEMCPPRLPRPVVVAEKACEEWLKGIIPEFEPLSKELLNGATAIQSTIDAFDLANKVVEEVSAFGSRARIGAKRETWGGFGVKEARQLAIVVENALNGRLSAEGYKSHVDELSRGMAA